MTENFIETLSVEEAELLRQDIEAAKQKVLSRRQDAHIEEATKNYKRDFLAIPRGPAGNGKRKSIKETYRALGVKVDSVDFTGLT